MPQLQLLHGQSDIEKALHGKTLKVFRYQLNRPFIILLLCISAACLLGAFALWYLFRFEGVATTVGLSLLTVVGLGLSGLVSHWHQFCKSHFVAATDEDLFVGSNQRLWRIGWTLLDKDALGFSDMALTSVKGVLDIDAADQNVRLHIFNAFAYIKDVPGLMLCILNHLSNDTNDTNDTVGEVIN